MKIYDCFLFFNEVDLLYIRLKTLYNIVDKFIIVDSTKTHQGEIRKHMYYEQYKDKYSEFQDKIIYIKCDIPDIKVINTYKIFSNSWKIEHYHRDYIKTILGTLNCNKDDLILISDVDEIIYPSKLLKVKSKIKNDELYFIHMHDIKRYLNCKKINDFIGTFIVRYQYLEKIESLSVDIRDKYCHHRSISNLHKICINNKLLYKVIVNGGVHLSTLGGPDSEGYKCRAYAHSEYNNNNLLIGKSKNICNNNLHNSRKYRLDNNFKFKKDDYFNINYNDDFKVGEYLLDEIKNNKHKYGHLFIFEKPYID
jgi:beta-1,4-mannosyl-glycoprotein beta-1,4-N-acetylglucosaminyltransferase